jgi:peptide/nickel transport system permease protein
MALAVMWFAYAYFGWDLSGLFSDEFRNAPWSLSKVGDLLFHLWLPILTLAWDEVAVLQRTMRANLLDELHKPYVTSARAGGLDEAKLIWEYPTRVALNPFVSAVGFALPQLISSATLVSIVLSLPMTGPLFLTALQSQDMYLAGAFVLLIGALTIVGILISDILLAWLDPRIRYSR